MSRERTPERGEGLIHVECLDGHQEASRKAFDALVQRFLRNAPNCKSGGLRLPTAYNGELPTEKAVSFRLGSSTITVEYYVNLGTPPRSSISIATPIIVDNLAQGWTIIHPREPIEYAKFESQPYYGDLEVRVKAKTRPDDHGWPILLDQYTAGGLLPPIQTEGRGKLEAFDNLTALLKDTKPQDPRYRHPRVEVYVK